MPALTLSSASLQDIEFTVQEGRLWMLQCRSGKRTGAGAVKIAVDLVNEGLVDKATAVTMVEPTHLDQLLHPQVRACPLPRALSTVLLEVQEYSSSKSTWTSSSTPRCGPQLSVPCPLALHGTMKGRVPKDACQGFVRGRMGSSFFC